MDWSVNSVESPKAPATLESIQQRIQMLHRLMFGSAATDHHTTKHTDTVQTTSNNVETRVQTLETPQFNNSPVQEALQYNNIPVITTYKSTQITNAVDKLEQSVPITLHSSERNNIHGTQNLHAIMLTTCFTLLTCVMYCRDFARDQTAASNVSLFGDSLGRGLKQKIWKPGLGKAH